MPCVLGGRADLEGLVPPLDAEECPLPLLHQLLFLEVDVLHLLLRLLEGLLCRQGFPLLRLKLGAVERELLVEVLQGLLQVVDEVVLVLLRLFPPLNTLLRHVGLAAGHSDLALHLIVVRLDLLEGPWKPTSAILKTP